MLAWKFLDGDRSPFQFFTWPLPNGKPGRWVHAKGDLAACKNGIHACTPEQAVDWLRSDLFVIELGGRIIDAGDKLVARKGRLIRKVEAWNERTQRLFAADCAEHVLHIFEEAYPADPRPREAIAVARAFAEGEATEEELNTAESAAWSAAWSAAESAAWSAARNAARSAAWSAAESAAWSAARNAARSAAWNAARNAAWSAARSAERRWQTERLAHYIGEVTA